MSARLQRGRAAIAIATACVVLASGCSSSASREAGWFSNDIDPTALPALSPVQSGNGERALPLFERSVVPATPTGSLVATSTQPTLDATLTSIGGRAKPNKKIAKQFKSANGTGQFWVANLGVSANDQQGWTTVGQSSTGRVTVPGGILRDGQAYQWRAVSPSGSHIGPVSFVVDSQRNQQQPADSFSGVGISLAAGVMNVMAETHTLNASSNQLGVGLAYRPGNASWLGMPTNWRLVTPNTVVWDQLKLPYGNEQVVSLHAKDGTWVNYSSAGNGLYQPVWQGKSPATSGKLPTLVRTADGNQPWTVTDTNQTVTTFGPVNSQNGTAQVVSASVSSVEGLRQSYDETGRLAALEDPVSGRKITFTYGGGKCPDAGEGLISAPDGLLCQVSFDDDSETRLGYVETASGPQVARVVDRPGTPGVAVMDYAYDQVGRLARKRSPLMAALQASDAVNAPTDDSALTSIAYDSTGRVTQVTAPVTQAGGPRMARAYQYATNNITTASSIDLSTNAKTTLSSVTYDPNTFNVTSVQDGDGFTTQYAWDPATGNLTKQLNPTGSIIQYGYDAVTGKLNSQTGPSRTINASSMTTTFAFDSSSASPTTAATPWNGLNFQVWSNGNWSGAPANASIGPVNGEGQMPSSLDVTWLPPNLPAGAGTGPWSGRMLGNITVANSGNYSLSSPGAQLWVDGVQCNPCSNVALNSGTHGVRIDFSAPNGGANGVSLLMGQGAAQPTKAISMAMLTPNYGLKTHQGSVDYANGQIQKIKNVFEYDQPATSQVTQTLNQSNFGVQSSYEPLKQANQQYGRPTGVTAPMGNKVAMQYWGGSEESEPPNCPDSESVSQAGLPSAIVDANPETGEATGLSYRQWYNKSGNPAAQQVAGLPIKCFTYDDGGRLVKTTQGTGDDQETVEISYNVNGNPLVAESEFTVDDGVVGEKTVKTSVTSDFAGRPIETVDAFGTVVRSVYDPHTGKPTVTTTTVNPGANQYVVTTTNAYAADASLTSVTITDNRNSKPVVATKKYQANGMLGSVSYSNGAVAQYSYDNNERGDAVEWTKGSQSWGASRVFAPSGRAISDSMNVGKATAKYNYDYDFAGRLTEADLSTTTPNLPGTWKYQYDNNSNRTSMQVDKQTPITYQYDKADRLTNVANDPALSGAVSYDGNNSITKIGNLEFSYGDSGQVQSVSDSTRDTVISYLRDADTNLLAKSVVVGKGDQAQTVTTKYTMDGILLDGNNNPYMQQVSLPAGVTVQRAIPAAASAEPKRDAADAPPQAQADSAAPVEGAPASATPEVPAEATASATASESASAAEPTESSPASDTPTESAPPSESQAPPAAPENPTPPPAAPAPIATTWLYSAMNGNALYQTDDQGNGIGDMLMYDPFGQSLSPLAPPQQQQPSLRWMTAQMIESQGLSTQVNVLGARMYLPALGRFTSVDPKQGGSANSYEYAHQDPVNNGDTSGKSPFDTFMWTMIASMAIPSVAGSLFEKGVTSLFSFDARSDLFPYMMMKLASGVIKAGLYVGIPNMIEGNTGGGNAKEFVEVASINAFSGAIQALLDYEGAFLGAHKGVKDSRIHNLRKQYDPSEWEAEQARATPTNAWEKTAGAINKGVDGVSDALLGPEGQRGIGSAGYLTSTAIKILVQPQLMVWQYNSWKAGQCKKHEVIVKHIGDICQSS